MQARPENRQVPDRSYDGGVRTRRRGRPRARRLTFALLAAVILGILGMHALARHDAMPPGGTVDRPSAGAAVTLMPMGHAHRAGGTVASADAPVAGPTSPAVGTSVRTVEPPGSAMSTMLVLCAAMLLTAGGALLVLRLRRLVGTGGLPLAPPRRPLVTRLAARVGTGPPYVWEYSVVRC